MSEKTMLIKGILVKPYQCLVCKHEKEIETNHYGEVYNTLCEGCGVPRIWKCTADIPEGAAIPEDWTLEEWEKEVDRLKKDKRKVEVCIAMLKHLPESKENLSKLELKFNQLEAIEHFLDGLLYKHS